MIVAYLEDGPDLVLMAMNGWAQPDPAWWLNLQAHPDAVADLPGGSSREVTAREAKGDERSRLWERWREVEKGDLDAYATRSTNTPSSSWSPARGTEAEAASAGSHARGPESGDPPRVSETGRGRLS